MIWVQGLGSRIGAANSYMGKTRHLASGGSSEMGHKDGRMRGQRTYSSGILFSFKILLISEITRD